jgi:serine/threonine protein kinase
VQQQEHTGTALASGGISSKSHEALAGTSTIHCSTPQEREYLQQLLLSGRLNGRSTSEFYAFGKILGVGSFGKVRVAWNKLTGEKVAIKTYEKSRLKEQNQWKRAQQEVRLMERLNHRNVIRLFETIESAKRVHIVMEFCGGGNLCSYVKMRKRLGEDEARRIFQQLALSLEYLHSKDIVHRDVKLENVLFDGEKNCKLVDFGFSVYVRDKKLKIFCGTPSYMAPEIVQRTEYLGKPVDIWSLGVVLYALLCGCFPFTAKNYPDLYKKIIRGHYRMPESLSHSVRDLLRNMLVTDPLRRYTLAQVMGHPWVKKKAHTGSARKPQCLEHLISSNPRDDLVPELLERLECFGLVNSVVVHSLLHKQHNAVTTLYYLLKSKRAKSKPAGGIGGLSAMTAQAASTTASAVIAQAPMF